MTRRMLKSPVRLMSEPANCEKRRKNAQIPRTL